MRKRDKKNIIVIYIILSSKLKVYLSLINKYITFTNIINTKSSKPSELAMLLNKEALHFLILFKNKNIWRFPGFCLSNTENSCFYFKARLSKIRKARQGLGSIKGIF